jgi:transketolase
MRSSRRTAALTRARAWLVTGPLGRGLAFAIDFALAVRTGLAQRRGRQSG